MTQLGRRNEAIAILIDYPKGFTNFFFAIRIFHLAGHHCKELRKINCSIT
uniref:Uncharacterized protein n=1 Tax=Parascaris univalens TaxID=6257 RepID=A0A915CII5_PARUN